MVNIAFIDIGTNSVRMLISGMKDGIKPRTISRHGVVTKLGEGLLKSRNLKQEAIERTIDVLENYKRICDEHECSDIVAFSTSVLRKAGNARDFIALLKRETGIDVEIISGEKEASLVLAAVKGELDDRNPLVVDIGGGSTEISYEDKSGISCKSLDIGALSLSETYSLNASIHERMIEDAERHAHNFLDNQFPEPGSERCLVGTGGTITSLASMIMGLKKYNSDKIHLKALTKSDVEGICGELSLMDAKDISQIKTLEQGREDTILGGAIILEPVISNSGFDSITVSTKGMLQGMVMEHHKKLFG